MLRINTNSAVDIDDKCRGLEASGSLLNARVSRPVL